MLFQNSALWSEQVDLWALSLPHAKERRGGYWNSFVGISTTGQQVTDKIVMFKDGDLMEQMINDVISSICVAIYREKTLTNR